MSLPTSSNLNAPTMTRINLDEVGSLMWKHLISEYRELPRVRHAYPRKSAPKIPKNFVLGKGHETFFYNKGIWLERRHRQLIAEMKRRGYQTNLPPLDLSHWPEEAMNDWVPTLEAIALSRSRIDERLAAMAQNGAKQKLSEIPLTRTSNRGIVVIRSNINYRKDKTMTNQITAKVIFTNCQHDFATPKKARAWVRNQGLTVKNSTKTVDGKVTIYTFAQTWEKLDDDPKEEETITVEEPTEERSAADRLMDLKRKKLALIAIDVCQIDKVPMTWTKGKILSEIAEVVDLELIAIEQNV